MPSFSSFFPTVNPGVSLSMRKAVMPRCLSAGCALANMRNTSASGVFVVQSLRPFNKKSLLDLIARMVKASLPESASKRV